MPEADIYFHSRKRMWSIRVAGRVVDHMPAVTATRCTMHVREGERRRALERGQRSVHAWIRGELQDVTVDHAAGLVEVGYSPWCARHFTTRPGFRPVFAARLVVFHPDGRAWALL